MQGSQRIMLAAFVCLDLYMIFFTTLRKRPYTSIDQGQGTGPPALTRPTPKKGEGLVDKDNSIEAKPARFPLMSPGAKPLPGTVFSVLPPVSFGRPGSHQEMCR